MGARTVIVILVLIFAAGFSRALFVREDSLRKTSVLPFGPDLTVSIDRAATGCRTGGPLSLLLNPANMTVTARVTLQPGDFAPDGAQKVTYRIFDNSTAKAEGYLALPTTGGSGLARFSMNVTNSTAHEVMIVVDPENYLPESNEANNTDKTVVFCK